MTAVPLAIDGGAAVPGPEVESPSRFVGRPARNFALWLSTIWLVIVVGAAITASWLPIDDPLALDVANKLSRPGQNGHLLGSDGLGRDILARLVHGSRVSLVVSLAAVSIGVIVGGVLGMTAGFVRGWFDRAVMAAADVLLAFPALVLLLGLLAYVGQSLFIITVTIGIVSIPRYTRVARANTLALATREFAIAAEVIGATRRRILLREIAPNVALPVVAFGFLSIGVVIVLEGSLSFLGLSVRPPTPTWGGMISEGRRFLQEAPHVSAIPSIAMFLTVLAVNFVGDHLRGRFFDLRDASI